MFGVFLDGFFFITVVSTQGVGKSDFILRRFVNCRYDEEEAEEDREEQEDDDDDEAAAEHERCGAALLQGLRPSQEDRILCVPDIPLPTFGKSFLFLVQEGFFFTQNLKFEALLSLFLSFVLYMGWQQQLQPREGTHLIGRILLLKNQGATNMMYLRRKLAYLRFLMAMVVTKPVNWHLRCSIETLSTICTRGVMAPFFFRATQGLQPPQQLQLGAAYHFQQKAKI
jgi:hypothetical protein